MAIKTRRPSVVSMMCLHCYEKRKISESHYLAFRSISYFLVFVTISNIYFTPVRREGYLANISLLYLPTGCK